MKLVAVCFVALLFASQCLASEQQSACAVCELVVQVAENYVESNATLQQIEAKAQALCNDLPSPYNGVCTNLVANNLPQIVAWLQNNEPPQTVCTQLQLCTSSEQVVETKRAIEQSPCAVCELVVQVAESYIANNATDQQIEAKLDAVCGDLPSPYNGECTLIVNAYLPQIIAWIQNNEPPATLCAQLSLCSSKKSEVAPIRRAVEQTPCAICELVVQVVESYVANNATDQQIEAKLDALCAKLPSPYSGQCALIVNSYLPQIISYIQNNESPATVCAQLSLCSSKPAPVKREVEQSICAVCELVVQVAESYITNNATDQQIEAKLDAVCGDLPSPYSGECTLIVNAYLPQIIAWIQNEEPPATFCAQIALCTSKSNAVSVPIKRAVEQSPCAVCELVVQVAETYITNNATDQQIEAKLDAVCGDLPSPYNGECTLIVNAYLPQIIAWIQNDEPPATLCAQLSLCSSKKSEAAPIKRAVEQSPCAVCELVVQVAESYIANNATDQQIEAKLDAVCGDLPSPYNGECTLIVNAYLPQIIAWIQNNEPPATLCAQLSLCSSKKSEVAPIRRAVEQTPCAICELVVQVVESYVANNATDQQIEAKLDALCAKLPSPYSGQCALIVNTYLPQIISYIQNNESPATVCAQLSLCSSKPAPVKREVEQSICAVCELVVQVAENYVENNATLAQIEAKLDSVCGDLPTPYNGECTLIVNSYLPQIVTWLQNDEPPATLCGQLSLCTSKKS